MADQKITQLTADTTPSSTDITKTTKDPAGSPLDRKVTLLDFVKGALSGIWTPASSSGPASFAFHEDTDNGSNKATIVAPASMAADRTLTLPDSTGTLVAQSDSTWTPTVTAGTGTFTSVSATGRYSLLGDLVFFNMDITITTNGTAATSVVATLPFTVIASNNYIVAGREDGATGHMIQGKIPAGSSTMSIFKYENSYPGGSGNVLRLSGFYRKA